MLQKEYVIQIQIPRRFWQFTVNKNFICLFWYLLWNFYLSAWIYIQVDQLMQKAPTQEDFAGLPFTKFFGSCLKINICRHTFKVYFSFASLNLLNFDGHFLCSSRKEAIKIWCRHGPFVLFPYISCSFLLNSNPIVLGRIAQPKPTKNPTPVLFFT